MQAKVESRRREKLCCDYFFTIPPDALGVLLAMFSFCYNFVIFGFEGDAVDVDTAGALR